MLEGGFWILIIEGLAVGAMFIALIVWVTSGALRRDRERLREFDEAQAKLAEEQTRAEAPAQDGTPPPPPSA